MGVYIKDMEKPKKCENCQFYIAFYIGNKKVGSTCELIHDVKSIEVKQNDCPLIEVVTCKDCKYFAFYSCSKLNLIVEENAFCAQGRKKEELKGE